MSPRQVTVVRAALAAAAALVAALALADLAAIPRMRAELLARVDAAGVDPAVRERVAEVVAEERTPARVRLAAAGEITRAHIESALPSPAAAADDPRRSAEDAVLQLELARRLAAEAAVELPASWQPPTLLGTSTYLARAAAGDPRLITESAAWDAPLTHAHALSPTAPEPIQALVTVYLDLWPVLSAEKRRTATALLRRAMEDPATFARLAEPWLDVAGEPDEAMAVLPDTAAVWERMQRIFRQRGDWRSFASARQRWRAALERELAARLAEAAALRRAGDDYAARQLYLGVLAAAPTERRFLPLVEHALAEAPAGPVEARLEAPLQRWLAWVLDLALTGEAPLPPQAIDRLAGLAGELPPALAAQAAVAAGRLEEGERRERRVPGAWAAADWEPYRVALARALLARGEAREAAAALGPHGGRPAGLLARAEVAAALGEPAAAEDARERLARRSGEPLPAAPPAPPERTAFELWLERPAAGLLVEPAPGRGEPVPVEIRIDGRLVDLRRARPGRSLRLFTELPAGLHLVELVAVGGGAAGAVRVAPLTALPGAEAAAAPDLPGAQQAAGGGGAADDR